MYRKQVRCGPLLFSLGLTACLSTDPPAHGLEATPLQAVAPATAAPESAQKPPLADEASHPIPTAPASGMPTKAARPASPTRAASPRAPPVPRDAVGTPSAKPDPLDEVRDCLKRNAPKRSSKQVLRFVSTDRFDVESECLGKVLVGPVADQRMGMKVCMMRPPDVRGTEFLSIGNADREPDSWLYLPEQGKPRRVTGSGMGGGVCRSDVSYEDLQRWKQLNRPEHLERLPDAEIGGRSVYVIASTPLDARHSAYSKVVSYIDRKTCVAIKSESYQNGGLLWKLMTVEHPDQMLEDEGVYAPSEVLVKDLRDGTHTSVSARDLEVDAATDPRSFDEKSLGRHCK